MKADPGAQRIELVDLDKIYQREVKGRFQSLRKITNLTLLAGYFLLPWFNWGPRPIVLFDLPERQFHILHMTFWPQDLFLLAFLLIIAAFGLFMVTVFAGRIWCGYTCPQTVWTQMFVWLETRIEGPRHKRIRLDQAPWSFNKASRKSAKHLSWMALATLTGLTFVGYFTPIRALVAELTQGMAHFQAYLWTGIFSALTYLNAGWMREKVCLHMCPYARFQSVMFDEDTKIVSYDPRRGEPRGKKNPNNTTGDCIDCGICVQVCPTGIDIRDGLQYECIGCALCIDACDGIMDKLDRPRGLISYTTENELLGKVTHLLRPRLIGYAVAMVAMVGAFTTFLVLRSPVELSIERDRGQLFSESKAGDIVNDFQISILNKKPVTMRYELAILGRPGAQLVAPEIIEVTSGERKTLAIQVEMAPKTVVQPRLPFTLEVRSLESTPVHDTLDSTFIGPKRW
ncbi:MAG: cytochrome c oxidase accessory protein CcoG [Pseudomonadales bacterium]|jgi:cytochrome c oxidase accessory protein FixG